MGFHPEGLDRETAGANRAAKQAHVEAGTLHQILVYDGDDCVGWCQYGAPAELPNIQNRKAYDKELVDLPDWRIGCIFTGSRQRGHGVARAAVTGALEAIRGAGGGLVEAYPEQVEDRAPQRGAYFHTGPENLFEEFGFVRDRQIAKWRWGMRRRVCPWVGDQVCWTVTLCGSCPPFPSPRWSPPATPATPAASARSTRSWTSRSGSASSCCPRAPARATSARR